MMKLSVISLTLVLWLSCFDSSASQDLSGRRHKRGRIQQDGGTWTRKDGRGRSHRTAKLKLKDLLLDEDEDVTLGIFGDGERRYARRDSTRQRSRTNMDGVMTYYGEDEEDESASITLVESFDEEGEVSVAGSVHQNGTILQIRTLPDGSVIVEETKSTDFDAEIEADLPDLPEYFLPLHMDEIDEPPQEADEGRSLRGYFSNSSDVGRRRLNRHTDGSTFDVLVLYTRSAMCAAAGQGRNCAGTASNKKSIESLIRLAAQESNKAYELSGINTEMRVVKMHYEANYDDKTNDWGKTLTSLRSKSDGQLDYVHAMRNQYGADFVAMLVDTGSYCGIGFRPNSPNEDNAFSLTQWSCATGYFSFGHEIAHNMGCNHDKVNAGGSSGTHNYGYQMKPYRSIMAYDCPGGCERVMRFSNPGKSYNGKTTGDNGANNAKWIRDHLRDYANFRPCKVDCGSSGSTSTTPSPTPRPTSRPTAHPTPAVAQPTPTLSSSPGALVADMDGGYIGAEGCIFDIQAKTDLTVLNFAVHSYAATTVKVEVYKLKFVGTSVGQQNNMQNWELIGTATVQAAGAGQPTILPMGFMDPVPVKAGTIQGFYVTFASDTNYNRYSGGSSFGSVYTENADIVFYEGYAKGYNNGAEYKPRIFNGLIYYKDGIATPATPAPTPVPTKPPTRSPTAAPVQAPVPTPSPTPFPTPSPTPAPVAATARPTSASEVSMSLETTFIGGNGQAGNMFEVKAKRRVTIYSLDIHTYATKSQQLYIFSRRGSFVGYETDSNAWTEIANTQVVGKGNGEPTPIPVGAMSPVTIEAGQTWSFYVTLSEATIRYTNDAIYHKDDNLEFISSSGKRYPFGDTYADRMWNGRLHYTVERGGSNPSPTPAPMVSGASGPPKMALTTYASGNGSYGNQFMVEATEDLLIYNLYIHTYHTSKITVEVYKLKELDATHIGTERQPQLWELVGSSDNVMGQGSGKPTRLPLGSMKEIFIPKGHKQALYVTILGGGIRYTNGASSSSSSLSLHTQNSDLKFYEGTGIGSGRFGGAFFPRVWNGIFEYYTPNVASSDSQQQDTQSVSELLAEKKNRGAPCKTHADCKSNICGSKTRSSSTTKRNRDAQGRDLSRKTCQKAPRSFNDDGDLE